MAIKRGTSLRDRLNGTARADQLYGLAGNDWLSGGNGNDMLDGGSGIDTMIGGAGNDMYSVESPADKILEQPNGGVDTVKATNTYTLPVNFENLTLLGTGSIDGLGNQLANTIVGNAGSNSLTGLEGDDILVGGDGQDYLSGGYGNDILDGGLDDDTMVGGLGNDTYTLDNINDQIIEILNGGTDTVRTAETYTLAANVENLTLLGPWDIDGQGNELANIIFGNEGNNTLTGMEGDDYLSGGDLEDQLNGGLGNDELFGDAGDDLLVDGDPLNEDDDVLSGGAGNDTIEVHNGTDSAYGGDGNDVLTAMASGSKYFFGEAGGDVLTGGTGIDVLNGGAGSDLLEGNEEFDSFEFDSPGSGSDVIVDYVIADDQLSISMSAYGMPFAVPGFNVLVGGGVAPIANTPTVFVDLTQGSTLSFSYDPDGIGPQAAEVIAILIGVQDYSTFTYDEIVFHQ